MPCVSVKRIEKKLSVSVPAGEQEQVGHVINFLCSLPKELCKVMFDWSIYISRRNSPRNLISILFTSTSWHRHALSAERCKE